MEIRKRLLALDIGTKRIGVAVSDVFWMGATPVKTINRNGDKSALDEIRKIAQENGCESIVIGVPYNMDGSLGFQAKNCIDFIKPLENEYKILYQDERLSSSEAEDILKSKNVKYTKNKSLVDTVAACIILTEYLDNNR